MPFRKLLIANRGEIAVRIARTCSALGITTVAVYSEADRDALHVRSCDEAYLIGPAPAADSYLRGDVIVEVARRADCDAIHPGFGFLSENASFAQAVIDASLTWIGPSPRAIALMGSKIEAKRLAMATGVPIVPGYFGDDQSLETLSAQAEIVGYPILVKASAGGGGKGMRVVEGPADLADGVEAARREAQAAFGDDAIMLERYLGEPRHIEVQVLGDNYGQLIHLGERECSIQRRHQKVLEECPSPVITSELREKITAAALALSRAAAYTNAGTVEFIFQNGEFYFLEMNTRLQVEHTVTEEAYDLDLVEAQLRIAAGEHLWIDQSEVESVGHAIEARLYAEDPVRGFLPSTGKITRLEAPHEENHVRIDPGVTLGDTITPYYDPMIAKIITSGPTRNDALRRMQEVLGGLSVGGVTTNLDFLRWLVGHPQFDMGNLSTHFIDKYYRPGAFPIVPVQVLLAGAAVRLLADEYDAPANLLPWQGTAWRLARLDLNSDFLVEGHLYSIRLSGVPGERDMWHAEVAQSDESLFSRDLRIRLRPKISEGQASVRAAAFEDTPPTVQLEIPGEPLQSLEYGWGEDDSVFVIWERREYWLRTAPTLSTERMDKSLHLLGENSLESPMPGKVLKLFVEEGVEVVEEQALVVIEAMKMEFTVRAPHDGKVASINFREGQQVSAGDILVELEKS